jgi:tRNA threonylcarbamoyladenosine biosynthesis protein TsaB
MKILALDTSSKFLSLVVAEDSKILSQTHRFLDRKHSLQLVPLIERILKKAKLTLKKIDGFCVGKGPGSFTGLRIGITCIKGLAFVLQKPIVAIPSLDILAQNARKFKIEKNKDSHLQVCPIIDAKQNKVYACLYQAQNGIIKRKSGYFLFSIQELLKILRGNTVFLGDGVKLYRAEICRSKNISPFFVEEKLWYPRATQAILLALERFQKGKYDDINSLVPLYLYPKECQIKLR